MKSWFRRLRRGSAPLAATVAAAKLDTAQAFQAAFAQHLAACEWAPHPDYSVFTQYDHEYYTRRRAEFEHKYRCFYAVARTLAPASIIELGTHAGSSADAYLSGAPGARYLGLDVFGEHAVSSYDGKPWRPYELATRLFEARGFSNWELMQVDLRTLTRLPRAAQCVVVDAAHDFDNAYADLQLALSADPEFIFADDAADPNDAQPAIERFLAELPPGRLAWQAPVDYTGGGLVMRLHRPGP